MSYAEFKRKAREHQVQFREEVLGVDYCKYPNVLHIADALKGLVFYAPFRDEILEELRKPVPKTSSAPSGQMLNNMLRSEHIPYNIFFPMRKNMDGCRELFNDILSKEEIGRVVSIDIEFHPEPIEEYLADHTAFDVYVSYVDMYGRSCGIGIEVKYTEKEYPLMEGTSEYKHVKDENGNTRLFLNYLNATLGSGYYKEDVSHDILVSNKFRQIWRNHILGASMVLHGNIHRFTSITLFPEANVHFSEDAMPKYAELLSDAGRESFVALTYERLFKLMERYFKIDEGWVEYLKNRYIF